MGKMETEMIYCLETPWLAGVGSIELEHLAVSQGEQNHFKGSP